MLRSRRAEAHRASADRLEGSSRVRIATLAARAAILATGLALLLAAPAQAGFRYTEPRDLPGTQGARGVWGLAADPQGRATALYSFFERPGITSLRLGPDGNPTGPAQTITADSGALQIATDARGGATVTWQGDHSTTGGAIQSRRVGPDGAPAGATQTLSDEPAGGRSRYPQLAVDPQGRATVVWLEHSFGPSYWLVSRSLGPDGTPVGPIRTLSGEEPKAIGSTFDVAVDSQGTATAVWVLSSGSDVQIQSRRIGADGVPDGPVRVLSTSGTGPQIAVDPQGRATVVWVASFGDGDRRVQSRRLGPDGAPISPPRAISPDPASPGAVGPLPNNPQVATDAQGRSWVIWESRSSFGVQGRLLGVDGAPLGPVRSLATGTSAFAARLAVDPQGRATAIWHRASALGSVSRIESRHLDADGRPSGPVITLDDDGVTPRIVVDPQGRVTAMWRANEPSIRIRFARGRVAPNGSQPSNRFALGKVNLNRKRGIARMVARVPGPGRVILRQTKQVRRAAAQAESAGRVRLRVRPRGKAQRRISNRRCQRSGKRRLAVRVQARVTYRPAEGEPQTQRRRVRLVRRC